MPFERTLLSARPPSPDDWLAALRTVDPHGVVQVLPGAAAQLVLDDTVVATVVRPRLVEAVGETARLLATDAPGLPWWTDVVAPTRSTALDDTLTAIIGAVGGRIL